jgi:hypothetical protein
MADLGKLCPIISVASRRSAMLSKRFVVAVVPSSSRKWVENLTGFPVVSNISIPAANWKS